jgi:hypothetical protein
MGELKEFLISDG